MTEWRELKTMQDVAAAQAAGDEIEVHGVAAWVPFEGKQWVASSLYRARPRKKTKTVVLREALFRYCDNQYHTLSCTAKYAAGMSSFVRWMDTTERVVEVEE